jgi:hypothetical protein
MPIERAMMATESSEDILNVEEVADIVRKSVATMYYLNAIGKGPRCGKLGKRLIYRRGDVWIESAFDGGV